MGEDDPRLVGIGDASAIPALHKAFPRSLARLGRVDHAMLGIGMDRLAGAACCERPRGVFLPVLMLPANIADLGRAVAPGQRSERSARLARSEGRRVGKEWGSTGRS